MTKSYNRMMHLLTDEEDAAVSNLHEHMTVSILTSALHLISLARLTVGDIRVSTRIDLEVKRDMATRFRKWLEKWEQALRTWRSQHDRTRFLVGSR